MHLDTLRMIDGLKKSQQWKPVIVAIVFSFFIGLALRLVMGEMVYGYERIVMRVNPSAERAYVYGIRHFDARNSEFYDVRKARYFLDLAATASSTLPYVNHQLARISFLYGDFDLALAYIDNELLHHPQLSASSHYVRGLILGYMGRYNEAASDYEKYLEHHPDNWAALNDYAWVLLKAGRAKEALEVTALGLNLFPENPWLLNSDAIARYEMGDIVGANNSIERAADTITYLSQQDWLASYPGNDPRIAEEGINTFKKSIENNMHMISLVKR